MLYWQHSLTVLYIFKKLLIPLHLHLKVQHTLADPCGESISWNSDFLSSMLSPEVL